MEGTRWLERAEHARLRKVPPRGGPKAARRCPGLGRSGGLPRTQSPPQAPACHRLQGAGPRQGAQQPRGQLAARRLVRQARAVDPIDARIAMGGIRRLREIGAEAGELEAEIRSLVETSESSRLLAVCRVEPIFAAKIPGATHDIALCRSPHSPHTPHTPGPLRYASSDTVHRHRLNLGAIASSTGPSSRLDALPSSSGGVTDHRQGSRRWRGSASFGASPPPATRPPPVSAPVTRCPIVLPRPDRGDREQECLVDTVRTGHC